MKIKRIVAPDMRLAIKQVREELGSDAVILANRKVAAGVEIVAAVDYDEEAIVKASLQEGSEGAANTAVERQQPSAPQAAPQRQPMQSEALAPTAPQGHGANHALQEDRVTLENVHALRPAAASAKTRTPAPQRAAEQMIETATRQPQPPQQPVSVSDLSDLEDEVMPKGYAERIARERRQQAPRAEAPAAIQPAPMPQAKPAPAPAPAPVMDAHQDRLAAASDEAAMYEPDQEMVEFARQAARKAEMAEYPAPAAPMPAQPLPTQVSAASSNESLMARHNDGVMMDIQRELQSLRGLMENQLSVMEWDHMTKRQPLRVGLLTRFNEMGISPELANVVVEQVREERDLERAWRQALSSLSAMIPIAEEDFMNVGGVVAVVGPTGVGKTTTIAKLAARFSIKHGQRNVALVSTDNYRIGAHEQLLSFARILGVPMKSASNHEELSRVLTGFYDKKLVLIDTAGMSQRDIRLSEQFVTLRESSPLIRPYLVVSANTQPVALDEIMKAFGRVDLNGMIITKLDEAYAMGGALAASIKHKLPISYVGVGQRVPEDLQPARAHRLVSRAMPMKDGQEEQMQPEALAVKFGGAAAYAHD